MFHFSPSMTHEWPQFVGWTRTARSRLISAQEQWGRDRALYLSVTQAIFREMCQRQAEHWTTGWRRNTSHSINHSPLLSVGVDIRLHGNDSKNSLRMTNYDSIKQNEQSVKYPQFKTATFYTFAPFIYFPSSPYVMKFDVSCCYFSSISLTLRIKLAVFVGILEVKIMLCVNLGDHSLCWFLNDSFLLLSFSKLSGWAG